MRPGTFKDHVRQAFVEAVENGREVERLTKLLQERTMTDFTETPFTRQFKKDCEALRKRISDRADYSEQEFQERRAYAAGSALTEEERRRWDLPWGNGFIHPELALAIIQTGRATMTERAELGVDGNCGFALVGPNIQEGEAEFEEFTGDVRTSEGARQAKLAINRAYQRLRARIGRPVSYFIGESHPDFC